MAKNKIQEIIQKKGNIIAGNSKQIDENLIGETFESELTSERADELYKRIVERLGIESESEGEYIKEILRKYIR